MSEQHLKKRNTSLDLLKIIISIGVIILHINNPDNGNAINIAYHNSEPITSRLLLILECCSIVSVNVFIMISGFFLASTNRRRFQKVLYLFVLCSFMSVVCYLLKSFISQTSVDLSVLLIKAIPNNYYITLYAVIYMISPLVNRAFEDYDIWSLCKVCFLLVILFAGIPTVLAIIDEKTGIFFNGLCTIGVGGSQSGYTIVNFALMYCLGYLVRKLYDSNYNINFIGGILLYIISMTVVCVWELLFFIKKDNMWSYALAYCNVFVVIASISLFYIFVSMNKLNVFEREWFCIGISELAQASLVSYLVHPFFINFSPIQTTIQNYKPLIAIALIILESFGIYLACFIVWKLLTIIKFMIISCYRKIK